MGDRKEEPGVYLQAWEHLTAKRLHKLIGCLAVGCRIGKLMFLKWFK